jgi:Acetyltransferase (GNAT) domain
MHLIRRYGGAMSDENQVRLGHQNLIDYSRASTQWASKGSLHQDGSALFFAGGSWIPVVGNGAFRTDDATDPAGFLAQTDAFFGRRKRGYSIKVRDDGKDDDLRVACEAHDLVPLGEPTPQMICYQRLDTPPLPEGISLRAVHDEQGVTDFGTVNADAYGTYGMPGEVFVQMFDRPQRVVADVSTAIVVAYRGEQPVATALTFLSGGVASLQWVGTVADARQLGLGRVVTVWATNAAFDMGATSVTLQASPMGAPLYAKLGYETRYHYRDYVCWTPPVPEAAMSTGVPPRAAER